MWMFKNPKLLTLFFTMIVVMLGFGIVIPIMPFYVESFGMGGTGMGFMMALFSIMQFIFSPFWGRLSDRYGRKKIMLIGAFGNGITMIFSGLVPNYPLLLLSRGLAGVLSAATLPTAMAYVGDSTDERGRGGGMGLIGAAMGVGMVIGPGLGGWLADISLSAPFFLAGGLSLLAMLPIWFILHESLPEAQRSQEKVTLRGPQLGELWKALRGPIGFLLFLAFLVNFALANFEGVFGLYADARYGYGPQQVGTIMMVIGIVSSVVQIALTGPATQRFGESWVIKASLLASVLGFVLMSRAEGAAVILLTVGFFVFSNAMLRPAIMSLTSKKAQTGQGVALGMNNAFQSLGRVAGPLWAGMMFDVNINFPYWSAALIMLGTFGYALWAMRLGVKEVGEATRAGRAPASQ
jgi:DHA1 family multidrug resistance protein-like MFS transporter